MSIMAQIMAVQVAKDSCAIETTPSIEYLRLAKQILFIIESHDFGNKVQEKTTKASVHAFADDSDVAYDKQERPQPGLAEGPKQPWELQQGPPTS